MLGLLGAKREMIFVLVSQINHTKDNQKLTNRARHFKLRYKLLAKWVIKSG